MKRTKFIVVNAVVSAIYVVLTMPLLSVASGPLQLRPAEALCILPALFPYTAVGVVVGCAVSNVTSAFGIADVLFGSLTTLVASVLTATLFKKKWLAPIPPVVLNALLLPLIWLTFGAVEIVYWYEVLSLLISQSIVCFGLGIPLYYLADGKLRPYLEINID